MQRGTGFLAKAALLTAAFIDGRVKEAFRVFFHGDAALRADTGAGGAAAAVDADFIDHIVSRIPF